ncbi:hypothetical protein [Limnoglobus roseus]|uniref:Uncharacterized protein n=1 Tax=Limnoglobus roseus TaxID=2598579 RepID=A0A5C1AH82_9BACT|nr:hypothetical protein [Limnoglobus roseus]QEL18779.1 hypothetical protein PX52LOC_05818 [Limnoglobus roseus]
MFIFVFAFLVTTAFYGFLAWLGMKRLVRHMQGSDEALKAIVQHVLVPVFGEGIAAEVAARTEEKPEPPKKEVF